jgi:hypothetical protein
MRIEYDLNRDQLADATRRQTAEPVSEVVKAVTLRVGPLLGVLLVLYSPVTSSLIPSLPSEDDLKVLDHKVGAWLMVGILVLLRAVIYIGLSIVLCRLATRAVLGRWIDRALAGVKLSKSLGHITMEVSETGVWTTTPIGEEHLHWHALRGVKQDNSYIYLILYDKTWYLVPKMAFASSDDAGAFFQKTAEWIENVEGSPFR